MDTKQSNLVGVPAPDTLTPRATASTFAGPEPGVGAALAEGVAALAMAISGIGLAIAVAALIFAGPLEAGLPRATGNYIMATAIVTGVIGWRSRLVPVVAVIQDGPAVVLVSVAAALAQTTDGDASVEVFVLIACITAVTGLAMIAIGHFGLSGIVRFLPTTVIGAFVAGTGWLLLKGGFDVMLNSSLGRSDLGHLFQPALMKLWLPGLVLGIAMQLLALTRRVPPVAMSLLVVGAAALFFTVVIAASSVIEVEQANWLIGPFPSGEGLQLVGIGELRSVDWGAIIANPGSILAVMAVSLAAVLLNLSSLEVVTNSRLDMRSELRTTGFVNLLIAPLGVTSGFHALGDTALARQMGARTRFVPLATGGLCLLAAGFGSRWVGYTPRFVAGGLLVAVGLGLLLSWARSMVACPSQGERILSAAILLLIATVGILEGLVVGLAVACLIFVVRYSLIDPVRLESTGLESPSRVERTLAEREGLARQADRLAVYQLAGYLFFGSFTAVASRIRSRIEVVDQLPKFVVLDFRHVTGIDTSAFAILDQLAGEIGMVDAELLISGLEPEFLPLGSGPGRRIFTRLDGAIEFAEEQLLGAAAPRERVDLTDAFGEISAALRCFLTPRRFEAGEVIIRQGEPGSTLYLVTSGTLAVSYSDAGGRSHRLRRIGSGAVVGELSVLTGLERSAEIAADTDVGLLELDRACYEILRRDHPTVALELHDLVLAELVGRAASLSQYLSSALR